MNNEQQNPATQILDAYRNAVVTRDVEAFMAIYDDDVLLFDAWTRFDEFGVDVWRGMINDWFSSHPGDEFELRFDDVHTVVGEDVAIAQGILSFTIIVDGVPSHQQVHRYTAGIQKKGDTWKIVHEHTSMPVDHRTGQGVLTR